MNVADFLAKVAADRLAIEAGQAPYGVHVCGNCNVPLQESTTGFRLMHGQAHCSDCYFDELSNGLEQHPLRPTRIPRGG